MSLVESYNEANIFLGLIEYELNSLLGASHLVDYISVHIRFDLERYLLNIIDLRQGENHVMCVIDVYLTLLSSFYKRSKSLNLFSKSVFDIKTRLVVTVDLEPKWMPNSDFATNLMPEYKFVGY